MNTGFSWGNLNGRYHSKYLGIDGKIILNGSPRSVIRGMDWIDLAQYTDRWHAVMDTIMNLGCL